MNSIATERSGPGLVRPTRGPGGTAGRAAGAERRIGRRTISVSLLLIGVVALVSGMWALFLPRGSFALPVHVAVGSVFGLLTLAHVRLNRNAIRLYLRDLGWSPAVLRLVLVAAIALALLPPALRLVQGGA